MKNLLMSSLFIFLAFGCATPKYRGLTQESIEKVTKSLVGKSPKEVTQIVGQPISAYYHEDGSSYHLIYPMNDGEVSLVDVMLNKQLECMSFNFEKEHNFKYQDWKVAGFTCTTIKQKKLDTSLID